ncbi:MAG: hypothetical protein IJZ33_04170 [Clostridia bacterium]|nr:hypothetical protein [Clostridia bacterium]
MNKTIAALLALQCRFCVAVTGRGRRHQPTVDKSPLDSPLTPCYNKSASGDAPRQTSPDCRRGGQL